VRRAVSCAATVSLAMLGVAASAAANAAARVPATAPRATTPNASPWPPARAGEAVAVPSTRADIDALGWLAGHWRSADVEEVWLAPRGGLMLAMTREIRGGVTPSSPAGTAPAATPPPRVSFEFLRIEQRADGTLVLLASPGGRPPTPFALAEMGPRRVRFTNTSHDFPQHILYWRDGDRLQARIEGIVEGRPVAIDYAWSRAPGP
jgi:hypothetical protein